MMIILRQFNSVSLRNFQTYIPFLLVEKQENLGPPEEFSARVDVEINRKANSKSFSSVFFCPVVIHDFLL